MSYGFLFSLNLIIYLKYIPFHGSLDKDSSPPVLSRQNSSSSLSIDELIQSTGSFVPKPIIVESVDETDVRVLNTGEILFRGEPLPDKGATRKSSTKSLPKKARMAVVDEETNNKDGEMSDGDISDVVSDEDLEMQELIRQEKRKKAGKPPKKEKQKSSSKKRKGKEGSDDEEDDTDRLLRMAHAALDDDVDDIPDETSDLDEVSDAEENANGNASERTRRKTRSAKNAMNKPNGSAFLKRLDSKKPNSEEKSTKKSSERKASKVKESPTPSDEDEKVVAPRTRLSKKEKELDKLVSSARKLLESSSDEENSSASNDVPVKKGSPPKRKRR
ncbi:hypothetical protein COOONC_06749 [Cooperia oncophora]